MTAAATSVRATGRLARCSHALVAEAPDAASASAARRRARANGATRAMKGMYRCPLGGIHDEGETVDRAHDHAGAGVAPALAPCAPDLAVNLHLTLGPELRQSHSRLPDEGADADAHAA